MQNNIVIVSYVIEILTKHISLIIITILIIIILYITVYSMIVVYVSIISVNLYTIHVYVYCANIIKRIPILYNYQ